MSTLKQPCPSTESIPGRISTDDLRLRTVDQRSWMKPFICNEFELTRQWNCKATQSGQARSIDDPFSLAYLIPLELKQARDSLLEVNRTALRLYFDYCQAAREDMIVASAGCSVLTPNFWSESSSCLLAVHPFYGRQIKSTPASAPQTAANCQDIAIHTHFSGLVAYPQQSESNNTDDEPFYEPIEVRWTKDREKTRQLVKRFLENTHGDY
jgi:hypothetical protein